MANLEGFDVIRVGPRELHESKARPGSPPVEGLPKSIEVRCRKCRVQFIGYKATRPASPGYFSGIAASGGAVVMSCVTPGCQAADIPAEDLL